MIPFEESSTEDILLHMNNLKATIERAEAGKAKAQEELIRRMKAQAITKVVAEHATGSVVGTLVEGERVYIDSDRLKKALGPKEWKVVTKQVLDNSLLEAAVALGKVSASTVAEASEVKKSSPYIRVSGQGHRKVKEIVATLDNDQKPAMRRIRAKQQKK